MSDTAPFSGMQTAVFAFDEQGGIYVGHEESGRIEYSSPTSPNAISAKRNTIRTVAAIARTILADRGWSLYLTLPPVRESVERKWATLNELDGQGKAQRIQFRVINKKG